MPLVSQAIKNLKGGISQQPDILKFPDQGTQQINGYSSEVHGLQKRPPSIHVGRLGASRSLGENPFIHLIDRDKTEKYYCIFTGTDIKVIDMAGNYKTVTAPDGWSYVTTSNPRDSLRMVTVADYTFIINKNVIVTESSTHTWPSYPSVNRRAILNVRGGQYGKTLTVTINGTNIASITTPDGSVATDINKVDTEYLITQLITAMTATVVNSWGWTISRGSGYILITAKSGDSINTIDTKDGYNHQLLVGFISDVQRFNSLPAIAPDGYIVKVDGEASSSQDDFYVRYDASTKTWKETMAPNMVEGLNSATMPWALVRNSDGTFTLQKLTWATRTCGDNDSNPMPSFVGATINDVFFFRNRLGLLSGENVILSRSGEYFKMFPLSVANLADTDPIDVSVSSNRINVLKHAVPFAEELLLWSDKAQFVLTSNGILTPMSIELNLTTEFEVSDGARPYGIGRGVYFCSPRATYSSIRRYYAIQDVTNIKNAEDISAHVPSYIPNGVFRLSGTTSENFLTCLTSGAKNKIFFYKFLYLNEQLAQESWSHWEYFENDRILACETIGAYMYIIIDSPSGIFLERVEFSVGTKDLTEEPYRLYMDRKKVYMIPAGTYNDDTFITTLTLSTIYGSTPALGTYMVVSPDGSLDIYEPPAVGGWASDGHIYLNGNWEGVTIIIGEAYEFLYEFSKLLIKRQDAQGASQTEDIGRLQLRRAWVNYEESGYFQVKVIGVGKEFSYDMTGRRLSSPDLILGDANLDTGQFRFPILTDAKKAKVLITSSIPSPLSIIGAGWEGNYMRRSSGV